LDDWGYFLWGGRSGWDEDGRNTRFIEKTMQRWWHTRAKTDRDETRVVEEVVDVVVELVE
jgi:hypothetical protein